MNLSLLLITLTFVKVFIGFPQVQAQDSATQRPNDAPNIMLKLGETKLYHLNALKKYSISNKASLEVKSINPHNILIKGVKKGEGTLFLQDGTQLKKISVKVVSANLFNLINEMEKQLVSKTVQLEPNNETLNISGEISSYDDYLLIQKNIFKYPFLNKLNLKITKPVRNRLITEIYYYFFSQNIDTIKCTEENLQFICHYSFNQEDALNVNPIIDLLKKTHDIIFIQTPLASINENFILKIKIIQIEKLNGEELDFGLDHFGGSFNDLFNIGVKGILMKHQFYFQEQNSDLSTLAEPEINIKLNKNALIEVGSEISFKDHLANNSDTITTHWKFAGLKLEVKLIPKGEHFEIEYQTSFSRSENASISTNKERSSVQINLNNPIKLFEIGLRTTANQQTSMPLLNKIPILKNIFSSKSTQDNFKKITGIIKLERGVVP